jgi:hypothetical protein
MCMSPHQMTSAAIEHHVREYREYAEKPEYKSMAPSYLWHADQLEKILKERAEDGTYDTAGYQRGDRNETQRTEYQSA